jgi:hypothetical protein
VAIAASLPRAGGARDRQTGPEGGGRVALDETFRREIAEGGLDRRTVVAADPVGQLDPACAVSEPIEDPAAEPPGRVGERRLRAPRLARYFEAPAGRDVLAQVPRRAVATSRTRWAT